MRIGIKEIKVNPRHRRIEPSRTDFSTNKVALRVGRVILAKYNKTHGQKLQYRFDG